MTGMLINPHRFAAAGGGGGTAYATAVLADTPWGFWRQADTSGTSLADSSGNSRPATITGTPTFGQTGPKDKAILWPASTSVYARRALGTNLSGTTGFTFECWVKFATTPTGNVTLMGNGQNPIDGSNTEVTVRLTSTGAPEIVLFDASFANRTLTGSALATGTWHHIVARFSTTTGVGMSLRVNKSTVASNTSWRALSNEYTRDIFIHAGGVNSTAQAVQIAESALYRNQILSDARVDAHYDA